MNHIFAKTFGGLNRQYVIRQLFFALILGALSIMVLRGSTQGLTMGALFTIVLNTVLYPYSRFVYESVVEFIMGNNVFYLSAVVMLISKLFTMIVCFLLAPFIAPLGLAYLYYHHSKS
jgi:hypothetical protein